MVGVTREEVLYAPRHYRMEEFVPPEVSAALGNRALLVMDYRILKTADAVREFFNRPVVINNWKFTGDRTQAGFRLHTCRVGAAYSQHRFGRALDMIIEKVSADEARRQVINNRNHFPYVTAIEDKVGWLHVDCRTVVSEDIFLFCRKK